MKTKEIKAMDFSKGCGGYDMLYQIEGVDYNVTGEFYYNKSKKRFEHEHWLDEDGNDIIIVYWPYEF